MKTITITKADKRLSGVLSLPPSKSISNRMLILQQLFGDKIGISNLSNADDTVLLQSILKEINLHKNSHEQIVIDTANAGTVMRFLTAYLSICPGKWILTGSDRMKERPIGQLVSALKLLGANIEYLGHLGYPPLMVKGRELKGGEVEVDAAVSSQFVSALVLIAPYLQKGLKIHLQGEAVSYPYVELTIKLLEYSGIRVFKEKNSIVVEHCEPKTVQLEVEPDWSAAAFWYETVALSDDAKLLLKGFRKGSFQGDAIISDIFRNFGVESEFLPDGLLLKKLKKISDGFYFDFKNHPDIALPVITTCLVKGLRGRFEGLQSLKIKETNRLSALKKEFVKLGATLSENSENDHDPIVEFIPQKIKSNVDITIETYQDHRMAMSFAPLAIYLGTIKIENPQVVSKSYPSFWDDISSLGFEIKQ